MKTIRLTILTFLAVVVFMTSCKYNAIDSTSESIQGDLLDLSDLETDNFLFLSSDTFKLRPELIAPVSPTEVITEIPLTRGDLTSMRKVTQIFNGTKDAGLTIPGFGGLKLGTGQSNLNVYYIETKMVKTQEDTVIYGTGYSVHYLFMKLKKGLTINNLASISASAQLESSKTQVLYSIQSYGIIGTNLVRYFKPTVNKNFDVEGFGILQSSIDGIHNILGDTVLSKSVRFTPEILYLVKPRDLMYK